MEDPVGKTVGRRRLKDAWKYGMEVQKTVNELRKSFRQGAFVRKEFSVLSLMRKLTHG